jgi:hypothetical protein
MVCVPSFIQQIPYNLNVTCSKKSTLFTINNYEVENLGDSQNTDFFLLTYLTNNNYPYDSVKTVKK